MSYKLIAIDMDGTLLNSKNQISKRNLSALYKAMEKGLYVVLSTGRILRSAFYYSNIIELNNPIVACNGAVVTCKDEEDIIYENKINIDTSKNIIQLADDFNMKYYFYSKDTFFTKEFHEGIKRYYGSGGEVLTQQGIKLEILENIPEFLETKEDAIYKFFFVEDDETKLSNFREELNSIEGINISSSRNNNIEIMNEGASKGNALEYLCNGLNIEKSQVIAIGDNENDISMLKIAGLAVAMGNGDDMIKEHSHLITGTNDEDGVAQIIEKYVLNS